MKTPLTRRSLKNARRRRVYLVSAALTALVLAAGSTAFAVQSNGGTASKNTAPSTTVKSAVRAHPASDGKRKHHKKRPTSTPTVAPSSTPTASASNSATAAPTVSSTPTATKTTATTAPSSTTAPAAAGSTENWASNVSSLYQKYARGGSSVTGGVSDAAAKDGKALNLTIPAGAGASPSNAAEVATNKEFTTGSFSSRVRTADCSAQPNTGAVTGIFTFGNDGTDQDGDGLTDNSEIDIEVLCARPDVLNLTIYTDYEDATAKSQRVSRVVDLKAGKVLSTCYYTDFSGNCKETLTGSQASPATVPAIAGFDSSKSYNDYRIDWTKTGVKFTLTPDSGSAITLWDYQGPADRIPARPASYLVNLWHTSDWAAEGKPNSVAAPSAPLTVAVDSSTTS